jgi:beta-hydroxylase
MQNNRNGLFKLFRDYNLKLYNSRIKTPAYLDLDEFFPEHLILEENYSLIKDEVMKVIESGKKLPKFHEVDDGQEYISNNDGVCWGLLSLKLYDMWHSKNIKLCPKTSELLRGIKNIKSAYFSILDKRKYIPPHKGPYKGILRYQLAISVPKKGECKIIVDDKEYFWKEGVGVLFDDTFTHEVQNNTDEIRVALLLDVKRKIPGFFMRIYDSFLFRLIQFLIILNNTFTKSKID